MRPTHPPPEQSGSGFPSGQSNLKAVPGLLNASGPGAVGTQLPSVTGNQSYQIFRVFCAVGFPVSLPMSEATGPDNVYPRNSDPRIVETAFIDAAGATESGQSGCRLDLQQIGSQNSRNYGTGLYRTCMADTKLYRQAGPGNPGIGQHSHFGRLARNWNPQNGEEPRPGNFRRG